MRYLGNKQSLLEILDDEISLRIPKKDKVVFCDAFSGTATVGNHFKDKCKIIANDNLYFSYVISYAKLNKPDLKFSKLGKDPFEIFNDLSNKRVGFITENYSPYKTCSRMYFSVDNAQRIDYIRFTVEDWYKSKKINTSEYMYLIACLLESVSKVANIAGVYGAYLKTWDSRAIKDMKFIHLEMDDKKALTKNTIYNETIEDLISKVSGDILYLDPPYTKNQYSTQYHILETIALNDNPIIKGITGGRDMSHLSSDWSRDGQVHIIFEKIIANAEFDHIFISYSSTGIMSKEYIESVLNRHGKNGTYKLLKIPYKKYLNHRTETEGEHFEFLFYVEKERDSSKVIYQSPLNYMGNKSPIAAFLKTNAPKDINHVADVFGGGLNAGINFNVKNLTYNDYNFKVKELLQMFEDVDTVTLYKYIKKTIVKYGLTKNGKEAYTKMRSDYNAQKLEKRDVKLLYVLVLFGFQQQIRFNSSYDYNNPVGEAGFNDSILEKIVSFSRLVKERKVVFMSGDYADVKVVKNTLVYCDPPYLITLGSYNDGKRGFNGWSEAEETRLLSYLDELDKKGVKFMLSNVIEHKGRRNTHLEDWINSRNYNLIHYTGSASRGRKEIIVTNYKN